MTTTNTPTSGAADLPKALRLADAIRASGQFTNLHTLYEADAELRTQHARITELEAQLSAIGAGGVGPLMAGSAGWQPIATAPKDGDVLLYSSITQRKPIIDRWHDYCRVNHPQFTHWQPLPAAPSSAGETK